MSKRVLVTTSDERTWPKDKPVLFLGEWCTRYSRRHVWESLDYKIMPCHWDDRREVHKTHALLIKLVDELVVELSSKLNGLHGTDYSVRYWNILLGPWLHRFARILYDRWVTLQHAIESNEVKVCNVLDKEPLEWIPNDMTEFTAFAVSDDWNERLYAQILHTFFAEKVDIHVLPHSDECKTHSKQVPIKRRIVFGLLFLYNRLCTRMNDCFFISSRLPFVREAKLQLSLGQLPKLWRSCNPRKTPAEQEKREWKLVGPADQSDFASLLRIFIPQQLPTAYLEGYVSLQEKSNSMPWPKNPKSIFTSNSFSADDVFKQWSARKSEEGSRLIIGQHGGFYGTSSLTVDEHHIMSTADSFITWGWQSKNSATTVPVGIYKSAGKADQKQPDGRCWPCRIIRPSL